MLCLNKVMKLTSTLLLAVLATAGCQKAAAPAAEPAPTPAPVANTAPQGGGGTTIRQYTPTNLGGITPVEGGESIEGGGSAAGSILKDRARHLPGASEGAPPAAPSEGGDAGGQ